MNKLIVALFVSLLTVTFPIKVFSCTSIIVSGKATVDGRPFIFKNRDTKGLDNVVVSVQGERYHYIAVVGAKEIKPSRVWSGYNEKGFAIVNTVAGNLTEKREVAKNGNIMKRALEICVTLQDFENLLDTLPKPLHVDSNFGVMDAEGGVAYYETGNYKYTKYDANDPKVAPEGYIIRSNFAFSGYDNRNGITRYYAMQEYVSDVLKKGKIEQTKFIREVPRYLKSIEYTEHPVGKTVTNLYDAEPKDARKRHLVSFTTFIPRRVTSCALLISGIKENENPLQTFAWIIAGSPLTTTAMPIWITDNHQLPLIVTRAGKEKHAPLVDAGLELKKKIFPPKANNRLNLAQLINKSGTGILQRIKPIEDEIFSKAKSVVESVHEKGMAGQEVYDFYKWIDQYVPVEYQKSFGIDMLVE